MVEDKCCLGLLILLSYWTWQVYIHCVAITHVLVIALIFIATAIQFLFGGNWFNFKPCSGEAD